METLKEKQLSLIRRYPLEILVYLLLAAFTVMGGVVYKLNEKTNSLQDEIKTFVQSENKVLIETVQKNTDALNKNTLIFEKLNDK